ncbi:agmatine deiminase family protein [Paenibacillus sp. GSMTC-2017]|uniref:agmatine deiminase family protein n=1 Tax=Paenibacillus sp. GSMTC-2017 TaxID=2794350 RepID=UPI0018D9CA88|nr:agmatine deiminase family protein [Paenibacillus sp. GSMTC-2017]MBH5319420.1 agmatine deiminase family protein [Paenibacillus sp. GSMTC-2017]
MKKMIALCLGGVLMTGSLVGCTQGYAAKEDTQIVKDVKQQTVGKYTMPDEKSKHEGTWLQWPHNYTYGEGHKENLESIWIEMTAALSEGENVHIIAYDKYEQEYIYDLLYDEGVDMNKIDFYIVPTDDVWARDTAPLFVYDKDNNMKLMDWGFNGWGKKTPYKKDALISKKLSKQLGMELIDLNKVVLEGGAFELDGNGTFLSTRSSVTNKNRNAKLSESEIEKYVKENLGVTNFIWLDGVEGMDITDFHIDGIAKFYDKSTLVTMNKADLEESGLTNKDYKTLMNAKNTSNKPYKYVLLPISKNNVVLDNGKNLGYKGSYINYYIGNNVVIVPNYNDPHDKVANETIQKLYPDREVIGIDVRELYKDGGMIHCVTQQQPISLK